MRKVAAIVVFLLGCTGPVGAGASGIPTDDGRPVTAAKAKECAAKLASAPVGFGTWVGTDDHTVRCRYKRDDSIVYHSIKPTWTSKERVKVKYHIATFTYSNRFGQKTGEDSFCQEHYSPLDVDRAKSWWFSMTGRRANAKCCQADPPADKCPAEKEVKFEHDDLGWDYAD